MQAPKVEAAPAPAPQAVLPAPPPVTVSVGQGGGSPRAVYEAVVAKREVLGDQMNRLLNRRNNVSERLSNSNIDPAEKAALEEHIQQLNARIIDMEKLLHAGDAEVAAAAGIPGAAVPESRDVAGGGLPDEMLIVGSVFAGIALVIIAIAYARRLWKGTTTVMAQIPAAFEARFARFEQSLDAVAIEIERVSEGQRFLTKVLAEETPRALGEGPAQPIETRAGVAEPIRRV